MYAARQDNTLPRDFNAGLLCLRERCPFLDNSPKKIVKPAFSKQDARSNTEVFAFVSANVSRCRLEQAPLALLHIPLIGLLSGA